MSGSLPGGPKAEPNLTPILDMVFQLITFFMLVINFKAAELDLSLQLPVLTSAKPLPPDQRGVKMLVLNVQICTPCKHPGCDALATLEREFNDPNDPKKVTAYKLKCERGHVEDCPHGAITNGNTCLSIYGHLYCKEPRTYRDGKDEIHLKSIEAYLTGEADQSRLAAGYGVDYIKEGKEFSDIVVIRADTICRFGAVYYIVDQCQKQGYRTFALKTFHSQKN